MSRFRKFFEQLRDKVFGRTTNEPEPIVPLIRTVFGPRLDEGPAKRWYVKNMFPRGCFTKKITPCRVEQIRSAFRRMRPEQQLIAFRLGYDKGVVV